MENIFFPIVVGINSKLQRKKIFRILQRAWNIFEKLL